MRLCDTDIERYLDDGIISLTPRPENDKINGATIDVRLGNSFRVFREHSAPYIDLSGPKEEVSAQLESVMSDEIIIGDDEAFFLHPGMLALATTLESVKLPANIIGWLDGRSSLARLGLMVHVTAHRIDPGWEGKIVLEFYNSGKLPLALRPNMVIGALSFEVLSGPAARPYISRKDAISLLIVLFAIFAFFYIQLQQAKSLLTEQLTKRDIQLETVSISLFPQPVISLEKVKYHAISAQKIEGKLPFISLIFGNPTIDEIQIQQARFTENALNSANIRMVFSDFALKQFLKKDLTFNGSNHIWVNLEKPIYGNTTTFDFLFNKGNIALRQEGESLIQFDDVQFNHQKLGYIEIHADLTKPQKLAIGYIRPTCTTNCLAVLKFSSYLQKSAVNFSGKNFPLTQLLALLNFPQTMTGTSDFNIQLAFANSELAQGKFDFNARDGELLGLNLLDMAAQYLPINYNSDLTASRNMNTPYERFESSLSFENHLLKVDKISLKTTALLGEGAGAIDLDNVQCDVNLTLRSTDEKYKKLALPIRFFDSCYAPQYKLNIDKNFRHQLKELIKEKLK